MRSRNQQRGLATVELGVLMTILVPFAFGISEYGRAIYQYNAIGKGVRDAARYLSLYAPGDEVRINNAKCLAVTGTMTDADGVCSATPLVAGLTARNVSICDRTNCRQTHDLADREGDVSYGVVNLRRSG